MTLDEIAELRTTLTIDADEARILAAACKIAADHTENSAPAHNPLAQFGSPGTMAMLLEGYAAMFEAASVAGVAQWGLPTRERSELSLSAIREHGTGTRSVKTESIESEETR